MDVTVASFAVGKGQVCRGVQEVFAFPELKRSADDVATPKNNDNNDDQNTFLRDNGTSLSTTASTKFSEVPHLSLLVAANGEHLARQSTGWPVALVASGTVVLARVGVVPRARARSRLVRPHEISDVAWVTTFCQ